jgi:hypothetical protein
MAGCPLPLGALSVGMRAIQAVHCPTTCEAIQSSKETKVASLNTGDKRIGSVGAKSVAAMVAVTSALTMCDLIYKQESLDGETKGVQQRKGWV